MLKKIVNFLFGQVSWAPPSWINSIQGKARANPKQFYTRLFGVLFALLAIYVGYHWYQTRPRPEQVIAQIIPPKITPPDEVLVPNNLIIDFGIASRGELSPRSVAPLNLVGKELTKGITMTPEIAGKWWWDSDSRLIFVPAVDWPAGQDFKIKVSKDFFRKNINMAEYNYSFATLPFEVVISEFKFYQDPVNPQIRQAVATVNFSYPVDTTSLNDKITLAKQGSYEHFKYTINYDKNKRSAFIHSEPLALPKTAYYLELILSPGIKPIAGPSETTDKTTAKVFIPDADSYFKVSSAAVNIVRNLKDQPEQILSIETSLGLTSDALNKSLHVYLLPKDYPATKSQEAQIDYQWHDPGEVTENILTLAKPVDLQLIPPDRDFATLHSYKFHAVTPAYIYVKIDKGIKGFGDLALANDYAAVLKVPDFPQEISFLHRGALLALGTEEKLSVLVRGLAAVKFNYARVLPDDVNHLITQTNGDFSNPIFTNPDFNQNNITEIFSQIQQFDASDPAKEQYTALDLSKYVARSSNSRNGGPLGLFLLQAHGWDVKKDEPLDVQTNRLILITDLGLLVKDNIDGTHDVFVQSITKGTPVGQAAVAILGKNGLPIITHNTDNAGRANFPSLNDFINEREPTVYVVRNGSDVSFIPYNRSDRQLNYSRFDIGGVTSNNNENQAALTAYLFSDRGIYRPGDTTHIGMIVKQPYVLPQPAGLPLEITITDPRGVTVKDEKLTLNNDGYLTLDYQTNAVSATGQYVANLYIVKDNRPSSLIGTMTFNVAEFLPDRMRITAHLSKEQAHGWISPADLSAKIGLWNLYGAPAANHRVTGKILLSPQAVTFKEFPDYTFIDPLLDPKAPPKVFTESLNETQTDDQGQAQLDLKLDRFDKATYQLTVFAEGFEAEGGRSVTTQVKALVSPLTYLVGYKPDGDLKYVKQDAARGVHFIAIDPQLKQQELSNLKLQLFKQQPVTTLVKKEDGTYQYQSLIQTSLISSKPFTISDQGSGYILPTNMIGDYLVTITDQNGLELSKFKFSVVGISQQPLPKNAELAVKLNKTEFAPGDEIEIEVTAPYTGAGLITIERDKVYASQWFKATTTTSIQKIHLPKDFQGNGYINIAFVRDLNSPEIFMSPLSYSVMPFAVTHQQHEIQVGLEVPSVARPGEPLTITYKTDKPGKIIVFAVDEGILQVTKYPTPNPLEFFFQKRALEVNTMQIVDQILPKFMADRELSAVGGDGGEAALYKNLNPFKRKTDLPVVYWSGIVDTDATPRQLIYQVPDYFNGTLRVMAVAVATDAVGAASTSTEVRGDFVINPNVPTFVAPGDEFDVTVGVANNVTGSGDANVNVQLVLTPQLEIVGDAKQMVTIPEGKEQSVHFKVKASSKLGSTELKFIAELGEKNSHLSSTLSIRPAIAYSSSINSGYATDSKSFKLDKVFYPEYRNVTAVAAPNPLILLVGMNEYLKEYPYGCTEQLTSKVLPLLAMAKQPWFANDAKTIQEKINTTIQMLSQRQMSSGAFNYWPETGSASSNDFATVYAMHFLTDAKEQGITVPNDLFSNGINYLKDFVIQDATNLEQARLRAYAIYILTRNEIVTTNYLTNLQLVLDKHPDFHWQTDITSAYLAATYQLLKNSTEAEKMIAYFKPQTNKTNTEYDFYNNDIANAQYLYLIAMHFPNRLQGLNDSLVPMLVNAINSNTISTVLSGYTTLAFAAYGQYYPTNDAAISIDEITKAQKTITLSSATGLYQKAIIDPDAEKIIFNNPSKQMYFYQITQAGFDKNLPEHEISQGIEAVREYHNADNNSLGNVRLGDEIIVHIRIGATDNQYHDNVAVVDLLPGGFEVVRDSVKLENNSYVDIREDRVIFFGSVSPESKEIIYRIKATNKGKFILPPIFAASMYNPQVKAMGIAGNISVE